ncbi:MAG: hypothetical protein ACK4K0_04830 [Flavobacteriales bacterium]
MKKLFSLIIFCASVIVNAQTTLHKVTPVQKTNTNQENKTTEANPIPVELKKATPAEVHTKSISIEQKQEINSSSFEKPIIIENIENTEVNKLETPMRAIEVSKNINTYSFNHSVMMDEEKSKRWANRMMQENKTIEEITIDSASCQIKLVSGLSNENVEKSISYCVSKFGYSTFKIK